MVVLVHDTHPTIHDPTMNYANMRFYEEINRDIKGSEKKKISVILLKIAVFSFKIS